MIDNAWASMKISFTALLAVEHGIRHAKGPYGLSKTLRILSSLDSSIRSEVSFFAGCYETFQTCTCMLTSLILNKYI